MLAFRKLCFLIAPCLAVSSIYVIDDKTTPSPPRYLLPTSSGYMKPSLAHSSQSLELPPSKPVVGVTGDYSHSPYTSVISGSLVAVLPSSNSQAINSTQSHTSRSISSSKHRTNAQPGSSSPSHVVTAILTTTRDTQNSIGGTSRTLSHSKETNGDDKTPIGSIIVPPIQPTAIRTPNNSLDVPKSTVSRPSKQTSVVFQSHSEIISSQPFTTRLMTSASHPKPSEGKTEASTDISSQSRAKSYTSSVDSTAMAIVTMHSTKQTGIAASASHRIHTGTSATQTLGAEVPRQSNTTGATESQRESSTTQPSHLVGGGTSAIRTISTAITTPTAMQSKDTSEAASHFSIQPTTSGNKGHKTATLKSERIASSIGRWTSSFSTKHTRPTSIENSNSSDTTTERTSAVSTGNRTNLFSTEKDVSSATTKSLTSLMSTGGQVISSTKQQGNTATAAEGQSASLPHPTTITRTSMTSQPIRTTIISSKGIVVTYVATQDPKYTTNKGKTTTTDDGGNDIVIFPGGWRWIPIGLPPLKLPPPPRLNPDPSSKDPGHQGHDDNGNDDDGHSDDGHDDDRQDQSKSTTNSDECTTTEPPKCTKTISFISRDAGFTSTIFGTCPPVSGCFSGEQSTTTTTIATSVSIIWADEPFDPDISIPLDNIDNDTIKYFGDLFEKQGISIEGDQNAPQRPNLQAQCNGNTLGIPLSCFNSIDSAFCREVEADLSKNLSKSFTGLDSIIGGPVGHPIVPNQRDVRNGLSKKRFLMRRGICGDWTLQFDWISTHGNCDKPCNDYLAILREQCLKDKSYDEGSLDTGCGIYHLKVKSVSRTIATQSGSSKQTYTLTTLSLTPTKASSTEEVTESPSPEPTDDPKTPLELKPVVCEDEANLPGHADIREEEQKISAGKFCASYFSRFHIHYMDSQNATVSETIDVAGTSYFYSVSWIGSCETTVDTQDPRKPLGDNDLSCTKIFVKSFKDCVNGGVGGYIDAGCLRYHFIGGI